MIRLTNNNVYIPNKDMYIYLFIYLFVFILFYQQRLNALVFHVKCMVSRTSSTDMKAKTHRPMNTCRVWLACTDISASWNWACNRIDFCLTSNVNAKSLQVESNLFKKDLKQFHQGSWPKLGTRK